MVSLCCRDDGEGMEGSLACGGHACSVHAAGGPGRLYNNSNGEPECFWLLLRSDSKFAKRLMKTPCYDCNFKKMLAFQQQQCNSGQAGGWHRILCALVRILRKLL